jgi:hypothetical protein
MATRGISQPTRADGVCIRMSRTHAALTRSLEILPRQLVLVAAARDTVLVGVPWLTRILMRRRRLHSDHRARSATAVRAVELVG